MLSRTLKAFNSALPRFYGHQHQIQSRFCRSDNFLHVSRTYPYLNPQAEHILDGFHITMRLTTMTQTAKGLPTTIGEGEETFELREDVLKSLESTKWYLWHGNVFRALEEIESIEADLEAAALEGSNDVARKLLKTVDEFHTYIRNNEAFIPNYGERFRQGETISTAFVESTVNQVVSKRMVKKQQMQWSERGAHLLLQVRTRVLDDELEDVFRGWYPGFRPPDSQQPQLREARPPLFSALHIPSSHD